MEEFEKQIEANKAEHDPITEIHKVKKKVKDNHQLLKQVMQQLNVNNSFGTPASLFLSSPRFVHLGCVCSHTHVAMVRPNERYRKSSVGCLYAKHPRMAPGHVMPSTKACASWKDLYDSPSPHPLSHLLTPSDPAHS
jgi:hypothetical protein